MFDSFTLSTDMETEWSDMKMVNLQKYSSKFDWVLEKIGANKRFSFAVKLDWGCFQWNAHYHMPRVFFTSSDKSNVAYTLSIQRRDFNENKIISKHTRSWQQDRRNWQHRQTVAKISRFDCRFFCFHTARCNDDKIQFPDFLTLTSTVKLKMT